MMQSGPSNPQSNTLSSGPLSQRKGLMATECTSRSTTTIKKNGKTFVVRKTWSDLTEEGFDTFLHKAIQKNKNNYADYLLDKIRDMNEHEEILKHKGQSGRTPLHEAVNYLYCNSERVKLVEKMIRLYPDALAMTSAAMYPSSSQDQTAKGVQKNYAPYKYVLELEAKEIRGIKQIGGSITLGKKSRGGAGGARALGRRPKVLNSQVDIDEMRRILRLRCMQYHGRNREVITNLIGKTAEIHLNLTSREEVTQQFFEFMAKLEFEPLLQYVYIPNLRAVNIKPADELSRQAWWKGSSRKDYFYIFDLLRASRGVKRILSIIVEDDAVDFQALPPGTMH